MKRSGSSSIVREVMMDFAERTGLVYSGKTPRRYLWTDAFAVCNFLELFRQTHDETCRDLALRLVDQVHHVLGRHRDDDTRTGWISGLGEEEGERHPTAGGLRIGKTVNERGPDEPSDERLEWDRDGQYYHYLTKWMHALNRVSRVTGDPAYAGWGIELARTAHHRFTHVPPWENRKRIYWKMSIDLSRPLVHSMGQHDPLDGLVTYGELQATAAAFGLAGLDTEIADMAEMCRGKSWATGDPLGIGGLLFDAWRMAQLIGRGTVGYANLLEEVLDAALRGLESFAEYNPLGLPAGQRLAFRELGLSIGLKAAGKMQDWLGNDAGFSGRKGSLRQRIEALMGNVPLGETIESFWMERENREAASWKEHREINMVMLATSLAPDGFLTI
ncbi:MAG: hypothetical protein FD174_2964 [Geobacteraceae bacterium]|nr:MAG: hypothetical protein FD174_2964 [Geobacteraceae bacterium]